MKKFLSIHSIFSSTKHTGKTKQKKEKWKMKRRKVFYMRKESSVDLLNIFLQFDEQTLSLNFWALVLWQRSTSNDDCAIEICGSNIH